MATVIAKVTEACNARCTYCDVVTKDGGVTRVMQDDVLEDLYRRTDEFLRDRPEQRMEIIWHGGEPLLAKPDFFWKALEYQERHCPRTADRIDHRIQTNLTRLDDQHIEALRALGVLGVGTSYEFLPALRGLGTRKDWEGYNRAFFDNVARLEDAGISWGVIYVVTKPATVNPLDTFYHLTNLRPGGGIMLNPVLLYEDDPEGLGVTPREFADFLGAIFPTWWKHRHRYPRVEPFSGYVDKLLEGGQAMSCVDSGACAESHFNLAPDGRLSQCGRSEDFHLLDYGRLADQAFAEVLHHPEREVLRERTRRLRTTDCEGCRYWDICHGMCPLDGWAEHGDFFHKSPWCLTRKAFLSETFEPLTGLRVEV